MNLEIGDMAYPAEVRMKLFNIYPENYKDRVEKLEKFLKIDPLPKIHEEVKVAEEASAV